MKTQIQKLEKRILINDIFLIIILGVILNMSVIIFNDSKMPVYFYQEETHDVSEDYIAFNNFDEVRYGYLGDIFKISRLKFSLGDVLVVVGGISLIGIIIFK